MKTFLVRAGIGLGVLILILIGIGFLLPTTWEAKASVEIDAPPEAIHPFVEDFRRWPKWLNEPDQFEFTFSGAETGKGAVFLSTSDHSKVELTITESDPEQGISYDGKIETDTVNARGSIRYEVRDGKTIVTWTDAGDVGGKPIAGYFVPLLEGGLRTHFEKSLKRLAELAAESK